MASWPPSAAPIAHGEPGSPGPAMSVLLAPLRATSCRSGAPAAGTRRRTPCRRRRPGAWPRSAACPALAACGGRVDLRAFRAREELVPGAVQRALPVHHQPLVGRSGQQVAQRELAQDLGDVRRGGRRQPVQRRDHVIGQHLGQLGQRGPGHLRRLDLRGRGGAGHARARGRAAEQQHALGEHQVHVLADRHLDRSVVEPAGDRVAPRLHAEVPQPSRSGATVAPYRSVPSASSRISTGGRARPCGSRSTTPAPSISCPSRNTVARDLEFLAGHGLGGIAPAVHDGLDVQDGDSADHVRKLPASGRQSGAADPNSRIRSEILAGGDRGQVNFRVRFPAGAGCG